MHPSRHDSRAAGLAPWLPYAAVVVGLDVLHSAWWALALYHAGMLSVLLAAGGAPAIRALTRGAAVRGGALLVASSLLAGPAIGLLWPWIVASHASVSESLASVGLSGAAWPTFAIYYVVVHPGIEEAYWRGWIVPRVRRPWVTDVQFAAYHGLVLTRFVRWPGVLAAVLVLVVTALTWRRFARASGGLAIPWLAHLAGDASFIVAVAMLASRRG